MRLSVPAVLCCCLLSSVLPRVPGAPQEPSSSLRKRFRLWMQSRMKRDVSTVAADQQRSDLHVGPEPDGPPNPPKPLLGWGLISRTRRSPSSKSSGCFLMTCAYPELFYRVHAAANTEKKNNVPENKMGQNGYGRRRRRRRSLPEGPERLLRTARQRLPKGA